MTLTFLDRQPRRLLLALASAATLAACRDSTAPDDPLSVVALRILDVPAAIGLGDTIVLRARLVDANDEDVPDVLPAWRTSTSSTLRLTPDGRAIAVGVGRAVLYAEVGDGRGARLDSAVVDVVRPPRDFAASIPRSTLGVEDTTRLTVDALDVRGVPLPVRPTVKFASTDTTVLTVDSLGLVTARGDGDAGVEVSGYGRRDTLGVHVELRRLVVAGDVPIVRLVGARYRACGLTPAGVAYCWGRRGSQAGLGAPFFATADSVAQPVAGAPAFATLDGDLDTFCGITSTGQLWCWGGIWNLGATFQEQLAPRRVVVADSSRAIASVHASTDGGMCAIDTAAETWCWGRNVFAQLGRVATDPATLEVRTPRPLPGGLRLRDVKPGLSHACGVDEAGGLWCWGTNGAAWGDPAISPSAQGTPNRIESPVAFRQVVLTLGATCALDVEGATWCLGLGTAGALGNGATPDGTVQSVPTRVAGAPRFTRLEARGHTTCGLTAEGELWCWGLKSRSNLLGSTVPVRFSRLLRFTEFTVTGNGPCGTTAEGRVYCARTTSYELW